MKYGTRLIFFICVSIVFINNLQAQCDSSYFRNTATLIKDVCLIDTSKIIAVGDNGYIIKSTDGGKNWRNINSYAWQVLTSVCFRGTNTGYAVGQYKTILKTEDQGESWFPLFAKLTSGSSDIFANFNDVFFFNENKGCIVGSDGKYITTIDGGRSWKDTTLHLTDQLYSVQFINDSVGFICGTSSSFYKTINGGQTWQKIPINAINQSQLLRKVLFINSSTGFIIGDNGLVLKTTDGGTTWTKITMTNTGSYYDIYFQNEQDGFIAGNWGNGLLLKTTNGGNEWTSVLILPSTVSSFYSISSDSAKKKMVIAGGGGTSEFFGHNGRNILSTTDSGASFVSLSRNSNIRYYDAFFMNDSTGYITGEGGYLFKTFDYGESWKPLTNIPRVNGGNPAKKIQFLDSLNGYASSDMIYKTTDGGITWTPTATPTIQPFFLAFQIHFFDTQKGLIIDGSRVFKTINGGASWVNVTSTGGNYSYYGFTVAPNGKAFTVGYGGNVQVSTDEGSTWTVLNLNTTKFLTSIDFYDSNLGFIGASDGSIFRTTDGGITWTNYNAIEVGWIPRSFRFTSSSVGYMAVDNNGNIYQIYKTINGGLTWYPVKSESGTLSRLAGFSTIYASSEWGIILKLSALEKPGKPGYIYGPDSSCIGNSSNFITGEMYGQNFNWTLSGGGTNRFKNNMDTVNWNSAGTHTLSLTASNYCGVGPARTFTTEVVLFNPVISQEDSVLIATEGRSYQWYKYNTPIHSSEGGTARTLIARMDAPYSVEVESYYGCKIRTADFNYAGIPVVLCPPVGSTTITSNVTGQYYNWQMSTGAGFIANLDTSEFVAGPFSQTIELKNIPSSWYGYQFRCLASTQGIPGFRTSNTFVLEFRNVWTGSANSEWENPLNWSCGVIPDSNTHVVISTGTVVINSSITIRKLTLKSPANLTVVPGNTLTITH